ncbi:MAG: TetR family transcriptional regulator [Rhodococcus sp. (in: high G+C Gram-positive bacteria)]|nr:MAG: TetR family transcriptional regulator [Rhodococcus sp. (in: high G+C Gram-positive bacteria)]
MSTAENDAAAPGTPPTRTYRSPRRRLQAAQTRAAVLEAAHELFAAHGWVGTSMRDIARTAGVSVETVYATVGSKVAVLKIALDVAVAGDDEPVALADRPEFLALGVGPTLEDRAGAAARLVGAINHRACLLDAALRQGAAVEDELGERLAELERGRREGTSAGGRLVAGRRLRATEFDELWMLTSIAVHNLLVRDSGWSRDRYEIWLADRIEELFSRPA